jgi:hypothetical protein
LHDLVHLRSLRETGEFRDLSQPTGEHTGSTIESWLCTLHLARVFGPPYRIFVWMRGFILPMLSMTGACSRWNERQVLSSNRFRLAPAAAP